MSNSAFFEGHVKPITTGWFEGSVAKISDPKLSNNGNEFVNVQFKLDDVTEPVFQAATLPFYDRIVMATGNNSRDPNTVTGGRVAIRIEVDEWGNKDVKRVQHIDAPRTTEQFRERRMRVTVSVPTTTESAPWDNIDGV